MSPKVSLTNRDIVKLQKALKALDGVVDGKELRRFDYSTETRWLIIKAQFIIDRAKDLFELANDNFFKESGLVEGEPISDNNREKILQFQRAQKELERQVQDLELPMVGAKQLEEKNQKFRIPPSVMVDLWPILEKGEDGSPMI